MRDRRPGFRYAQSELQKQHASRHPREVLHALPFARRHHYCRIELRTCNGAAAANPIDAFLAGAKAAAQFDFTGTLARLCVLPQTAPGADEAPRPPPERATWYTDPGKVFDNLYFVGSKIHSAWALTTSEGIILIDTVYDYNS